MSFVVVDKPRPHVTLITLNRPERMNAMAFDVMIPFKETLEEISYDNDTRVVVVTGAGHGFCSGADLTDSGTLPNIASPNCKSAIRRRHKMLLAVKQCGCPACTPPSRGQHEDLLCRSHD